MISTQVTADYRDFVLFQRLYGKLDIPLTDSQQTFRLFPHRGAAKNFGNQLVARRGEVFHLLDQFLDGDIAVFGCRQTFPVP